MDSAQQGPDPHLARTAASDLAADAETQILLVTSSQGTAGFEVFRLNPTSRLASEFRQAARHFGDRLTEATLVPYSAGRNPDPHEVAWLSVADAPVIEPLLTDFTQPLNVELFDPESRHAARLRLYAVSVKANDSWVHFLRAMSPRARLRRSGKIVAFATGATFDSLETEPLLFDTTNFDGVVAAGVVLIAQQSSFQRALGFVQEARALATRTLKTITAKISIKNADQFIDAATTQLQMIAKVQSIAEKLDKDARYAAAMTMPKIVAFLKARPDLEIDIEGPEGEEQLVFHPDPQRRWRILKLLDDDYLHSQITELDYEANSKQMLP